MLKNRTFETYIWISSLIFSAVFLFAEKSEASTYIAARLIS